MVVPLPTRIDANLPAGLTNKSMDHGEPKPGSLADRLGRKERIESLRNDVRRHAGASIGDAERDVLAGSKLPLLRRPLVQPFVGGFDGDAASVRHRVARIDAEIEQGAFELRRIDSCWSKCRPRQRLPLQRSGPTVRLISSSIPLINRLMLVGLGSSVWRREKASSRCVSAAARRAELWAPMM